MNDMKASDPAIACLSLALERNRQLFREAHELSCAALDLLDRPYLDAETFVQYQAQRRYADLKYHDAIEHLRLIMTEHHVSRFSTENPDRVSPPTLGEN